MVILFQVTSTQAQNWDTIEHCRTDTILFEQPIPMKPTEVADTTYPYLAVLCTTKARSGMRFDMGVSGYSYNAETKAWLGNHGGPSIGIAFFYNRFNIGCRAKPWTVIPRKDLMFHQLLLTDSALLNPIKVDYYIGYSIDLLHNISFEPYAGYTRSSFHVINEKELGHEYKIGRTGGLLLGGTLNKYFRTSAYGYFGISVSGGYGMVDFTRVHPALGSGYSEWNIGITYKWAFMKKYYKRIGKA